MSDPQTDKPGLLRRFWALPTDSVPKTLFVAIALCRDVAVVVRSVARHDRSLADQLKRASASVALNIAESDGVSGGNRVQRRKTALGSAREVGACFDVAEAFGYVRVIDPAARGRLDHVIGGLVKLTR